MPKSKSLSNSVKMMHYDQMPEEIRKGNPHVTKDNPWFLLKYNHNTGETQIHSIVGKKRPSPEQELAFLSAYSQGFHGKTACWATEYFQIKEATLMGSARRVFRDPEMSSNRWAGGMIGGMLGTGLGTVTTGHPFGAVGAATGAGLVAANQLLSQPSRDAARMALIQRLRKEHSMARKTQLPATLPFE
jgi:hypothetical protein